MILLKLCIKFCKQLGLSYPTLPACKQLTDVFCVALVGWEFNNRYVIRNNAGQQVYWGVEGRSCLQNLIQ